MLLPSCRSADARIYQAHISREAWEQENAGSLPETVKDLTRIELLATPPNMEAHVFCIAMRDISPFALDGTTEFVELRRGEVALLPYAPLVPLMERGDVMLT